MKALLAILLASVSSAALASPSIQFIASSGNGTHLWYGNVQIQVPAGTQNGDLMLAYMANQATSCSTPQTGWTLVKQVTNTIQSACLYSRVASNEPASYTWTNVVYPGGIIRTYRNAASVDASSAAVTTYATSLTLPALANPAKSGEVEVVFGDYDQEGSTVTGPSGATNIFTESVYRSMYAGDIALGSSAPAVTLNGSAGSSYWDGIAVSIVPAAASTAPPPPPPPPPSGNAGKAIATHHYDYGRTGWNPTEAILTPSTVRSSQFGLIATIPLDDLVDAQPLFVPSVRILGPKPGRYNIVYVATENNTVYGINPATGAVLLKRNLGAPVPAPFGCDNNGPHIGITGTPVFNDLLYVIYVITYTLSDDGKTPIYVLHSLQAWDLNDNTPPVTVTAMHKLTDGTTLTFDARYQRQRPALAYVPRNVYAAFGSFCDLQSSHSRGWLLGWSGATLTPFAANQLNDALPLSTGYFLSSIWMSGAGPAADLGKNLYFTTGNTLAGTHDGVRNISESAVRIAPDLSSVQSIFAPADANTLDREDGDFGSGGMMILPNQSGAYYKLAVAAGKSGTVYLFNANSLGGFTNGGPDNVLDSQQDAGCWCAPSYFTGADGVGRVVTSGGFNLKVWKVITSLTGKPHLQLESGPTPIRTGQDPGFFTAVSSNGTQPGSAIIWAVSRPVSSYTQDPNGIYLYAFSTAPNSSGVLPQLLSIRAGDWPYRNANANIVPVVANGKVFVASHQELLIFGLTSGSPTALASPNLMVQAKAPIATAKASVAGAPTENAVGAEPHQVTGILAKIDGSTLFLKTRTKAIVMVNDMAAINTEEAAVLVEGNAFTASGATYDAKGKLNAAKIIRAKPLSSGWPDDR